MPIDADDRSEDELLVWLDHIEKSLCSGYVDLLWASRVRSEVHDRVGPAQGVNEAMTGDQVDWCGSGPAGDHHFMAGIGQQAGHLRSEQASASEDRDVHEIRLAISSPERIGVMVDSKSASAAT